MTKYFFHIVYQDAAALDVDGGFFSTPYRAITEAELNLLTYALEAKVHGKPVPREVAILEEGSPRKLIGVRSTEL